MSRIRQLAFVVLIVFGTCKVEVDDKSLTLARHDEICQGVPTPAVVAEFHVFDRGALYLLTRHLSVKIVFVWF